MGTRPTVRLPGIDWSAYRSEAPLDRLMLFKPPRYETDPVRVDDLAAILTARRAREGLVVVWEVHSPDGRPSLPHADRAILRRRPATLDLLVTYRTPSTPGERTCGRLVKEATRPLCPVALLSGKVSFGDDGRLIAYSTPDGLRKASSTWVHDRKSGSDALVPESSSHGLMIPEFVGDSLLFIVAADPPGEGQEFQDDVLCAVERRRAVEELTNDMNLPHWGDLRRGYPSGADSISSKE